MIFLQGAGAIFNEILDKEGNTKQPEYLYRKIGIADIGFRTTDYITLDKMDYIDKDFGTIDVRINHALKMLDTDMLLHEVEFAEELKNDIEESKKKIAKTIADNIYTKIPRLQKYFAFYLGGVAQNTCNKEYLKVI